MDVSNSANPQMSALHADPLCGGCPPTAPQTNSLWPSLPQSFPAWPGQLTQPTQPTQPGPCWTGQPNTPCWPGTQTVPVSVPTTVQYPMQVMPPVPAAATVITPVPAPAPTSPVQPCQPCWPSSSYQPTQSPAPIQAQVPAQAPVQVPAQVPFQVPAQAPVQVPAQVPFQVPAQTPTPVLVPTTTSAPAATIRPQLPGWPAHPGWAGWPGQSGWPGQNPSTMPIHWIPPTSGPLSVPYNLNLSRGVYDKMMMTILGHVKTNGKMFTVNFLKGNDIALHINPRFNEGGKQVVVRNHKLGERWGPEERELKGPFPFALGSPFEMKILCTPEAFRVAVNNMPLFEFRHRIREFNQVNRINILHDVVLTYVNVETLP